MKKSLIELIFKEIKLALSICLFKEFRFSTTYLDIRLLKKIMEEKKKVLVIEDSEAFQQIINKLLETDFQIKTLEEVTEGLDVCKSYQPDIILLDIKLPGTMSGFDFLKSVKNNEEYGHIPVIIMSSLSSQEIIAEGLRLGANDYLVKPFDLKNLLFKIKNLLTIIEKSRQKTLIENMIPFETHSSRNSNIIETLNKISDKSINTGIDINIVDIVKDLGISQSTLNRIIKNTFGVTTANYLLSRRLEKARILIFSDRAMPMKEIATSLGFNSMSYFSKCYKDYFGLKPSKAK